MSTIKDLREKLDAAVARAAEAATKGDEAAELRAIGEEDAARAELHAAIATARKLAGRRLERTARAAAEAGGYQVGAFDVGLYDVDEGKLPPGGVALLRSPSVDARKKFDVAMKAAADDVTLEVEAAITYICDCTISPAFGPPPDPAAVAYRTFWETTGRGVVNNATMQVSKLGGLQGEHFKRMSR